MKKCQVPAIINNYVKRFLFLITLNALIENTLSYISPLDIISGPYAKIPDPSFIDIALDNHLPYNLIKNEIFFLTPE